MREGGLLTTRREATTIYYSITSGHVEALMTFLCDHFGQVEPQGAGRNVIK
jgi:DNA-binding transcriptional ArsR family regulator